MTTHVIAQRELLYAVKGAEEKKNLTIKVHAPYPLQEGAVNFDFSVGTSCCLVTFDEIDEKVEFFGMDSLQTLQFLVNIDKYIAQFGKKYDFYWSTGEPYF